MNYWSCSRCGRTQPDHPPYCLNCGHDVGPTQPVSDDLRDVVTRFEILNTEVWVFPTRIFGDRSFGYWIGPVPDPSAPSGVEYPFQDYIGLPDGEYHERGYLIDAIANSANNFLIGGSGIARALNESLGVGYTRENERLLTAHGGELELGKAYFVALENRFCRVRRGVVQAISIRYLKTAGGKLAGDPTTQSHVFDCVYHALVLCNNLGLRDVAIPQMASRKGYSIYAAHVAPVVMLQATLNAILTFLSEYDTTSIRRICLHPSDYESELLVVSALCSVLVR